MTIFACGTRCSQVDDTVVIGHSGLCSKNRPLITMADEVSTGPTAFVTHLMLGTFLYSETQITAES